MGGCVASPAVEDVGEAVGASVSVAPFTKHCAIVVQGKGTKSLESDYLPRVVQCEDGGATGAALRAQAIAARSYAYYKIRRYGSILDGQGDQVYSCSTPPSAGAIAAVNETEGMVLRHQGTAIVGFFVAGAMDQKAPACQGSTNDPYDTEKHVTYNDGKTGDDVVKSSLGGASSPENRGCMSQYGGRCLSDSGKSYDQILEFYYGADIEVASTSGDCSGGGPVAECHVSSTGTTTITDSRECFELSGSQWWDYQSGEEHAYYTYTTSDANPGSSGKYYLKFDSPGTYEVSVCVPDVGAVKVSKQARYKIWANGSAQYSTIDQATALGTCTSLGSFQFAGGSGQAVRLDDNTGEPYASGSTNSRLYHSVLQITPVIGVGACATPPCDSPGVSPNSAGGCSAAQESTRPLGVDAMTSFVAALCGFAARRCRRVERRDRPPASGRRL